MNVIEHPGKSVCMRNRGDLLSCKVLSEQDANQTEYLNLMLFQKMVCYSFIIVSPPTHFSLLPLPHDLDEIFLCSQTNPECSRGPGKRNGTKGDLDFNTASPPWPWTRRALLWQGSACLQLFGCELFWGMSCCVTSLPPVALFSRRRDGNSPQREGRVS